MNVMLPLIESEVCMLDFATILGGATLCNPLVTELGGGRTYASHYRN
jgi:hypothetical protein